LNLQAELRISKALTFYVGVLGRLLGMMLHLHRESSLVVLLHLLLLLLLLLHAVHVVHYHLLRCDLLGVHGLLGRVLRLLQMHFLVLNNPGDRFPFVQLLITRMTRHLTLRRPANSDSRFVPNTVCHFLLSTARNREPWVLSTQMVHFRRGLLVYRGL
jgi:glycosyltransferase involved in cell wall biosynthesis